MSAYQRFVRTIKSLGLGGVASRLQFLLPDRAVTRNVDGLGPFRFRLRRHRWMMGDDPFGRGHHASTLTMFRELIAPGDVVYDVGANIGYYARFLANMNASRVICFEPMTENADLLEANIALGNLEKIVSVYRLALSDHNGDELLQVDDIMGGTAVLDAVSGGKPSEARQHVGLPPKTESVRVARLDDLVASEKLPPPNVIKIDTEGAEALVLAGATQTLRAYRPRLAIALHGPEPTRQTIELLHSLGYACLGRIDDGIDGPRRRLVEADAVRLRDNNIVAMPEEAQPSTPR